VNTPRNTPRCPRCHAAHPGLITFTAAELAALTDAELDQLDAIGSDVCKQAAWWRAWRRQKDGNGEAA
jgi:uncharacterized membrane protein